MSQLRTLPLKQNHDKNVNHDPTPSAFTDAVHDNEGSCRSTGQLTEVTVTSPPVISVNRPNTTSTPDPTDSLHPPDRSPRPQRHILI